MPPPVVVTKALAGMVIRRCLQTQRKHWPQIARSSLNSCSGLSSSSSPAALARALPSGAHLTSGRIFARGAQDCLRWQSMVAAWACSSAVFLIERTTRARRTCGPTLARSSRTQELAETSYQTSDNVVCESAMSMLPPPPTITTTRHMTMSLPQADTVQGSRRRHCWRRR